MTGINHKQAQRYLRAAADGLLRDNQRALLDAHLRECGSCRAEADELDALEARLKKNFQAKWDAHDGPSKNVMTTIHSRSRRIIMSNRINIGLKMLAGVAALFIFGFTFNYVVSRLRNTSTAANGPQSIEVATSVSSSQPDNNLIAFTSAQNGNLDIYTMHADGSGLTNLTNNPADDVNPFWSPGGRHIAFESDRDGFVQIYLMNADGSNPIQLTSDKGDHAIELNRDNRYNSWSPDGDSIVFSQRLPGEEKWTLYKMNIAVGNKVPLSDKADNFSDVSWSPDGKHIAYIVANSQNPVAQRLYVVNADGNNPVEINKLLPSNELLDRFGYWSSNSNSIYFIAYTPESPVWKAYEANLDANALTEMSTAKSLILDWRDGTYLEMSSNGGVLFSFHRMDGTSSTFYPWKGRDEPRCGSELARSFKGDFFYQRLLLQ